MNYSRSSRFTAALLAICVVCACATQTCVAAQHSSSTPPSPLNNITPETRGDLLMIHRSYQAAIDAYSSDPEQSAAILNKIGIAYHHLYAIDKAMISYERALQLDPGFADALNNLGAAYYSQKDYKKAERYYRKALKFSPHEATYHKNLGAAFFAEGKFHKGAQAYHDAFLDDPNTFDNNASNLISEPVSVTGRSNQDYCLAALFAQAGMNDRAIDYLRKAFSSGFSDYKRLMADNDFASLRKTTEFAHLMKDERQNRYQ
jgi:tetratricopeptide (TPR) repeat protein